MLFWRLLSLPFVIFIYFSLLVALKTTMKSGWMKTSFEQAKKKNEENVKIYENVIRSHCYSNLERKERVHLPTRTLRTNLHFPFWSLHFLEAYDLASPVQFDAVGSGILCGTTTTTLSHNRWHMSYAIERQTNQKKNCVISRKKRNKKNVKRETAKKMRNCVTAQIKSEIILYCWSSLFSFSFEMCKNAATIVAVIIKLQRKVADKKSKMENKKKNIDRKQRSATSLNIGREKEMVRSIKLQNECVFQCMCE